MCIILHVKRSIFLLALWVAVVVVSYKYQESIIWTPGYMYKYYIDVGPADIKKTTASCRVPRPTARMLQQHPLPVETHKGKDSRNNNNNKYTISRSVKVNNVNQYKTY